MKTLIDPPSGWNFGFPKELPIGVTDINKWLIENGYPQSEVDYWKGNVPCSVSQYEAQKKGAE